MIDKKEYDVYTSKMDKTISLLTEELAEIRAGRANPAVLNKITVDYYGTETPIPQVGNVSVPEARLLVFTPWEAKMLKEVERAILKSDLGINPSNDGKSIKLIFPALTEERRLDLAKQVRKMGEDAKVAIRSIRRDAVEYFKNQKKKSVITEDDQKQSEKDIQQFTDKHIEEIDKIVSRKDKELMEL
ncbi:MAG: ribosome recycling factor [Clostridia bacterium]|nr:ribosome recycling factor [Clostridia bacterium]